MSAPAAGMASGPLRTTQRATQLPMGAAVGVGAALLGFGAIGISADAGYGGVGPNFLPWVVAASKRKAWAEALAKNTWTAALMTGPAFHKFVDDEFASLRAVMAKSGMI